MLSFLKSYFQKSKSFAKKAFVVLLVYFIALSLFGYFFNKDTARPAYDPVQQNRKEIYNLINDKEMRSTPVGKISSASLRVVSCLLLGEACTNNPSDGNQNFRLSLVGQATNLIVGPFANPPASGLAWTINGLANAGFIPKTYAASQGIGFASLEPLSKTWKALRDVAYLIVVLFLIAYGFMIMFRVKINQQTIISIENSLPRIVIALLMITFSFAIAGFLIDLMYVVIALIISVLAPPAGLNVTALQNRYIGAGPGEIFLSLTKHSPGGWDILWTLPNSLLAVVPFIGILARLVGSIVGMIYVFPWFFGHIWIPLITKLFNVVATADIGFIAHVGVQWQDIGEALSGWIGFLALMPIAVAVGVFILVPLTFGLLLFLALIVIFFRIFFILLTSYVKVIFFILISPIYLLQVSIPGRSIFSGWLRSMVVELLTFPIVIAIFIFAVIITDGATNGNFFRLPFMFGIGPSSFATVISMWILYSTPTFVKALRKIIEPKPLPIQATPSAFFGGIGGGVNNVVGRFGSYAMLAHYVPALRGLLNKTGIVRIGENVAPGAGHSNKP